MGDKYKINPDYVPSEPAAADRFCCLDDPGDADARYLAASEVFKRWEADGIQQVRVTLTGPDIEGDESGYPAGLWIEGWKDRNARQLPFGTSEEPGGAVWPPVAAP